MSLKPLDFRNEPPPIKEFIEFREKCGWGSLSREAAKKTLEAGVIDITVYDVEKVVGFGRVIGDGCIYFYIQDLIVDEAYRGQGLGFEMMKQLIRQIHIIASSGASIGLMSAKGIDVFYEKLGFIARPNERFGAGMILEIPRT